ncbi:MAG: hypothetical protein Q7T19_11610 [Caulobacter sp.]|nr:hypothetical protein [Caulobacter sp.]
MPTGSNENRATIARMGRFPKLTPMGLAATYALAMPLAVGFLANPKALQILSAPNLAEWVQAGGSILAIFGSAAIAILVDKRSALRLENERAKDRAELLQAVCDLADDAVKAVICISKSYLEDLHGSVHMGVPQLGDLSEIAAALDRIDVVPLNSAAASRAWFRLLKTCRSGRAHSAQAMSDFSNYGSLSPDSDELFEAWPHWIGAIRDELMALR